MGVLPIETKTIILKLFQMKMKAAINTMVLILISVVAFSQGMYYTKTGKVSFYSKAPLEDIEAKNRTATSVLNITTGQVEVSIPMKGFEFEKALMQEHFNENYVESDKFPKASFKGIINDLSKTDLSVNGKYTATIDGKLTLHGETRYITTPVTFTNENGSIRAVAEFTVALEDYKISVPSIVKDKIGKDVKILIEFNYEGLKH